VRGLERKYRGFNQIEWRDIGVGRSMWCGMRVNQG